jgi:hypothetical protein
MVHKKSYPALEYAISLERMDFYLKNSVPEVLLKELEDFVLRNSVVVHEEKHKCCDKCLKAHALSKARWIKLDSRALANLAGVFDCEEGHDGYYLDGKELRKI